MIVNSVDGAMSDEFERKRKPMDAALRQYLDAIALPASASPVSDEEQARLRRTLMLQAREKRGAIPGLPNGVQTRDVAISSGLTARLYTPPHADAPLPVLLYLHGGGWVAGSIETHDPFCRLLAGAAGIIVLSLEYRLAPEHPFPAALDDVLAAYRWAPAHAESFGGDPQRLLLGGDSAGGNLAAVAANLICSTEEPAPKALLLLYPVTDHPSGRHASYVENETGYGLEMSLMRWLWKQYAREVSPDDPKVSPLRAASVPALPPTLVATAEYDPLRDEGLEYAKKLESAGIAVTRTHAPDMHHNFPVHPGTVARFPQSVAALEEFAAWLRGVVRWQDARRSGTPA